jgi:hypothetical protein
MKKKAIDIRFRYLGNDFEMAFERLKTQKEN